MAASAAEPLKVKTGEWEITTATRDARHAADAPRDAAKMTPEQQAKMAAMFGGGGAGKPKEHKSKECITQEDLEKPLHPDDEDECESTILKSDGKTQDIALECKGDHPSTGKMHVEAVSSESLKGEFDLAFVGGSNPDRLKIHTTINGRWLGPTCKEEDEEASRRRSALPRPLAVRRDVEAFALFLLADAQADHELHDAEGDEGDDARSRPRPGPRPSPGSAAARRCPDSPSSP